MRKGAFPILKLVTSQRLKLGLLFALSCLVLSSATSCKESLSVNMEVSLDNDFFVFSNSPDYSCLADTTSEPDLQALTMNLRTLMVKWKGKTPMTLDAARIVLNSPDLAGGVFDKEISGTDFNALFSVSTSPVLAAGGTQNTNCDVKVGGIQLIDPARSAFGSGYISIRGFTRENEKEDAIQVPVSERAYFSFQYIPTE